MLLVAIYFLIPEDNFPVLINKETGEVTLEEGIPPFQVLLMKEGKEIFYGEVKEKGTFSIAKYLTEIGTYQILIEDTRKKTVKKSLTLRKGSLK